MHRRFALVATCASLLLALGPVADLPLGAAPATAKKKGKKRPPRPFASDTVSDPDPTGFWGGIECDDDRRHQVIGTGGDPNPTITGEDQGNDSFRRLSVFDGDDYWGERCQLGQDYFRGRTAVYREGTRWITQMSVRLPSTSAYQEDAWQVVMQMKQAGGAANSSGTPVLSLDAYGGHWRFRQSLSPREASDSRELWSAPASTGTWTRFSFDIRYSRKPGRGFLNVSADLNADGDFADAGETSGTIRTYTLKVETRGGERDPFRPGSSLPSYLGAGMYHDEDIDCPSPVGCYIDLDNIQVMRAG